MNTELKFVKTEKFVKGNKVTVIETAEVDLTKIRAFTIARQIPFIEEVLTITEPSYFDGKLLFKERGTAKCDPEDEFNEKTGFYIAQSRAAKKVMKKYSAFLNKILNLIDELCYRDLEAIHTRTLDATCALSDHIKFDLIGQE